IAEVDMVLGVVGLEPQRLTDFRDRLGHLPLASQTLAEVGTRPGVAGPLADVLTKRRDRGVEGRAGLSSTSPPLEGRTHAHQMTPFARPEPGQLPEDCERLLRFPSGF